MNSKNNKNKLDEEQIDLGFTGMDQVNDRQYNSMIPNKKGKLDALSYFKNSQKYAGQTKYKQQEQDQQQSIQQPQNQEQQQPEEADGIKQALLQIKQKRKQRSNLLYEDLKAIDKEDRENLLRMKQDQRQQGNPQALQNQLNQFNKLIQIRYYSQKNLQNLKKYPINNYPASPSLHHLHKQSQKVALTNLQKLVHNYQKLSVDFFKDQINITKYDDILTSTSNNLRSKRLNVQKLWQRFQQQTKEINQKMQKQIVNWSQRTVLLRNSTSKSQYNSLFMQTPIGQCKKAISDWDKVSKKCQQKRSPFRILFQPEQNLRQNYDKNIYDDLDLVQQVQKNYQQELQRDDKDFLMNDTLKYLQNKSKTKISKDVDRKASKNRKIRYNAHPKLLNFMPCQVQNFLEARDQIVKNLFNKGTEKEEAIDFIDI